MKNILKISILSVSAFFCTTSCDDYVEIDPLHTIDADNFYKTETDYNRALIAAYDLMQTSYLTFWLGEIASDNSIAGGESVTDSEGLHQIDAMNHGAQNAELRSLWRFMYAGITRVNYLFENKDKLEFEGKDKLYGEAYFLRAYYYSELVKVFGAVPLIVDKRLASSELASTPRTPAADVYKQIESDLIHASNALSWTTTDTGRITKGAALALLGKVYLYQNKFSEAAATLDQVINEGPYDLFPDFNTLFLLENENSTESVFDIQYVGSEGGGYGCFVCLEGFVAPGFQGIRGYEGPLYGDGNSYNLPTQELAEALKDDPRLNATVLDIEAWKDQDPDNIKYTTGAGGHTGYYNNKYIKRKTELGPPDDDLTSPLNHHVIRFADVLLMAAEAHNRKPAANDDLARQYLNRVRARVGLLPRDNAGASLTEAIWAERRLELAGEGLRFFDLVRTGKAAEVIDDFVTGKHELFPIPQDEIDLAGAGWEQNSGY